MSGGSSKTAAIVSLIPLEIMDTILYNLRVHWLRDLASCALVCRAWREFTRPHLFYELSFSFVTHSMADYLTCAYPPYVHPQGRTLETLIDFLERSPHIQTCIQKLTLRRQSPSNGALHSQTRTQVLSLLSPTLLPSLRHLTLLNVLFVRPFAPGDAPLSSQLVDPALVPHLDTLHIDFTHNGSICGIDILYLLSVFKSVHHLTLKGRPTITDTTQLVQHELGTPPYRFVEPEVLTLTSLFSYFPVLRMSSATILKSVRAFNAGLFRNPEEPDVSELEQVLQETSESCDELALYYTLLDRYDRCHPPDFSFCTPFVNKFTLQFSLYEEEAAQPNTAIWALASKVLSTLIPNSSISPPDHPFHLRTIVLKVSGREQPTNWLPELYDHYDLIRGLDNEVVLRHARLLEDVLLRLLEAKDLFGDDGLVFAEDGEELGSGLIVKVMPHDYMPPFDKRIQGLIKMAFPRLHAMHIMEF